MGTPLSIASFMGRAAKFSAHARSDAPSSEAQRIAFLESDNKSLSSQIEKLVSEIDWIKQRRRSDPAKISVADVIDVVSPVLQHIAASYLRTRQTEGSH